jgi:hypothetical protein
VTPGKTVFEGNASEERLQAVQGIFLQAVEHIEKQYGSDAAATWTDEANEATPCSDQQFAGQPR